MRFPPHFLLTMDIELTNEQRAFIDFYLETMEIGESVRRAGFSKDRDECQRIGLELLANDIIQDAINTRRSELNRLSTNIDFNKEDLLRIFWNMYNESRRKGKIKEAKEILEDIARWKGVEPDKVKTEIAQLNFNLDGDKI